MNGGIMSLNAVDKYARLLAETFGSQLAVAAHQSSSTRLVVNISTGEASAVALLANVGGIPIIIGGLLSSLASGKEYCAKITRDNY
jgi:hypothetical protein